MKVSVLCLIAALAVLVSCGNIEGNETISCLAPESVTVGGELKERVLRNFDRLEEEKYRPENVFLTEQQSGNWPGDTEGRTILGLVMDARATGRTPEYLEEIIALLPEKLNERGYMGPVYENKMSEQQLSGNGWMLRGLCEYYEWTGDKTVLEYIKSISENLFVAGIGYYAEYPVDPDFREKNVGGEAGTVKVRGTDKWILSSDVGCLFIGMDGAIHAYKHLGSPKLKEAIDEMLEVFDKIDFLKIQAQTHATLTACRGLVRYSEITGEKSYLDKAENIWKLYKAYGMTEAHGNYNWFDRYDTWTEPCAIVDSYMLAVQLWMNTGKKEYVEDAEHIYYNAIAFAQRSNGGFGTDNCPGLASGEDFLRPRIYEAHWCCTMRGGEGLGSAVKYSAFVRKDTVYVPFMRECSFNAALAKGDIRFAESTGYPFDTKVEFAVEKNTAGKVSLKLPHMSWMLNPVLTYNGKQIDVKEENGFFCVTKKFSEGDIISMAFEHEIRKEGTINKANTLPTQYKYYKGPLLLCREGESLVPVYHLMSADIKDLPKDKNKIRKHILFEDK